MKPYVGDSLKSRKRAEHDIHHRTQDGGLANRKATAKAEKKSARRVGKKSTKGGDSIQGEQQ